MSALQMKSNRSGHWGCEREIAEESTGFPPTSYPCQTHPSLHWPDLTANVNVGTHTNYALLFTGEFDNLPGRQRNPAFEGTSSPLLCRSELSGHLHSSCSTTRYYYWVHCRSTLAPWKADGGPLLDVHRHRIRLPRWVFTGMKLKSVPGRVLRGDNRSSSWVKASPRIIMYAAHLKMDLSHMRDQLQGRKPLRWFKTGDLASATPSGDQTAGELNRQGVSGVWHSKRGCKTCCLDISMALSVHLRCIHPNKNLGID
ncbi:hypothetical protein VTN02DRAFT_3117 [Thermoascus thermophilus]